MTDIIDSGFGGMNTLAGGAGFIGGLVLGSIWNGNGFGGFGNRGNLAYDNASTAQLAGIQSSINNLGLQQLQTTNDTTARMQQSVTSAFEGLQGTLASNNITNVQGLGNIQNAITANTGATALGISNLANQMSQLGCVLSHAITDEGCKNRELQRQIQTEEISAVLADTKAENAALKAQINTNQALAQQTAYLISQLGTKATATA